MRNFQHGPKMLKIIVLSAFLFSCQTQDPFLSQAELITSDATRFYEAIDTSKNVLLLSTYKLQAHALPEQELLKHLTDAVQRGVEVSVIGEDRLSPEERRASTGSSKQDAVGAFTQGGVRLIPSQIFEGSHMKLALFDPKQKDGFAILGTTNFDKSFVQRESDGSEILTRDFSVMIHKRENLEAFEQLETVFRHDALGKDVTQEMRQGPLIWGPHHNDRYLEFLSQAKKRIDIYQQDFTDSRFVDAVIAASERGVKVRILMSRFPFGKKHGNKSEQAQKRMLEKGQGRILVHLTERLHVHAKVLMIDGEVLILSSLNFYQPDIDSQRNLGIVVRNADVLKKVTETFQSDWDM